MTLAVDAARLGEAFRAVGRAARRALDVDSLSDVLQRHIDNEITHATGGLVRTSAQQEHRKVRDKAMENKHHEVQDLIDTLREALGDEEGPVHIPGRAMATAVLRLSESSLANALAVDTLLESNAKLTDQVTILRIQCGLDTSSGLGAKRAGYVRKVRVTRGVSTQPTKGNVDG